ncbi:hypothetical protein M3Y97_00822700 [Aphelenchoides bicaudatus]|nr:hypothetical protein M3Y97_00822700 [Aphelenchoides bicaudatus]
MSVSARSHNDSIMDQIFSAVQLPAVHNEEVHDNNIKAEQESILAELDQVLQKQRSLSESSDSSSHTLQEQHSHRPHHEDEHFYDDVASENHYDTIQDLHHEREPSIPPHQHQSYDNLAAEEVDHFPNDNRPIHADLASLRHLQLRSRSQTIDSQVSVAESRFGTFEVQDEDGRYKGSQINLHHDEVAYARPKQKPASKRVSESKSESSRKQPTPKATPRQSFQPADRASIDAYVQQVTSSRSRRSSVISLARSIKEAPTQNGKPPVLPPPPTNGVHHHAKTPSTFSGFATFDSPLVEEPIEFNQTVIGHLESGELMHEVNGYGLVQPTFNEFCHQKFHHFVIGNNKGQTAEEEKVVLLVGESKVGKTSFVYSALNYLYGVEREFDFRFAIEPPNEVRSTHNEVNMYTVCNTVLNQKISFVDTPGIEKEHTLDTLREWINFRLTKKDQLKIDAIVVFEKHGEKNSLHSKLSAKYSQLETLLGGDIRTLTVPAYSFANNYTSTSGPIRPFINLPFPVESYLLFNNAGFFPTKHNLTQLIQFKTSCASFDELFFAVNFKFHPVVLARRH